MSKIIRVEKTVTIPVIEVIELTMPDLNREPTGYCIFDSIPECMGIDCTNCLFSAVNLKYFKEVLRKGTE